MYSNVDIDDKIQALQSIVERVRNGETLEEAVFNGLENTFGKINEKLDLQLLHFYSQLQKNHRISDYTISNVEHALVRGKGLKNVAKILSYSPYAVVAKASHK
jgi:hypothetical protein